MSSGSVLFLLDDGETLRVAENDLKEVYELLWRLAAKPGAVSTAALLRRMSRMSEFSRTRVELTAPQSAALREAVALLNRESS